VMVTMHLHPFRGMGVQRYSSPLIVVVQSPLLYRAVGQNSKAIFLRGPTIRSFPIVNST